MDELRYIDLQADGTLSPDDLEWIGADAWSQQCGKCGETIVELYQFWDEHHEPLCGACLLKSWHESLPGAESEGDDG